MRTLIELAPILSIFVVVFGMGLAWGKLVKKKEIYNEDGEQKYQTKQNCSSSIEEFKTSIAGLKKSQETFQKDLGKTMTDIHKFMGAVTQYMVMHNGGTKHDKTDTD